ncbi:MAG: thioredoxin family protein [Urechidicola sp.]|nr:thioredoxin family protein [Urechidicola sp.]
MKYIYILVFAVTFLSCKNTSEKKDILVIKSEFKSEINKIVPDTIDDGMMLLGVVNREGFKNELFLDWYQENFKEHVLDSTTIEVLAPKLKDVTIKVFMGTWCSDSQREIPALYKILDAVKYDYSKFSIIAVSHEKDTPNHLEKELDIEYVPTIIIYKKDKEIGRFVEFAQENLEKDLLAIINEVGYKNSYEE